jgi:methylated-DNA-[protein]-cysteine S-methyltransferase
MDPRSLSLDSSLPNPTGDLSGGAGSATESCYLNTPVGWLRIAADRGGLTEIRFIAEPPMGVEQLTLPHLKDAYKQLSEYFRGERLTFTLPLNPRGTPFQRKVWDGLCTIPYGSTVSYKTLAGQVGCPDGARAIGMANNKNPLPIVVPCHRVVGSGGDLSGYGAGVDIKRRLLELEGANDVD